MFKFLRKLVLGPAYFYHVHLIKKSKRWSRSDIENYQAQKITTLDVDFTTKDDIRNNPDMYLRKSLFVPIRQVRTGGTSGTPFKFFQDLFFTRQKERAYLFDIWRDVGYKGFDYKIVVRGNMPKKAIAYNMINNSLVISQNYFVEEHRAHIVELFSKKACFLHVYPSTLLFLVEFFGDDTFQKFPIKGVLAGSEAFPIEQMTWFKKKFDVPIAHWYGHSEYAILARFCHNCKEFHFYPTYGKMDLLKEDHDYKILATGFQRYGTQFRRYFTGDFAKPSQNDCQLDNYNKVHAIVGREQDFIFDNKGVKRAFGPYLFGIHNEFWDYILDIQFIQKTKGNIEVKFVVSKEFNETAFKTIIKDRFELYNVQFIRVEQIEKTVSGKHVYFRQQVQ
ncbi:hypothetical protein [uncultured Psychroserpens sp.]|uniref:hypothetical protein n=1 Tax=uncultured Psychroserpens sp. TaxID=255436 RepID=UPI0026171B8F|nr:hypothetical protein [uncultured Psychroserpens sp.]